MNKAISVITLGPSLEEKGGMGSVAKLIASAEHPDFDIQHISTWNSNSSRIALAFLFIRALWHLSKLLSSGKVDIVHIHISERGSLFRKATVALVTRLFGKPFILHAHGCEFHIFYDRLPKVGKYLVNKFLQESSQVLVLSDSWRQVYIDMCSLNPDKVVTLKNPVTIPALIPAKSIDKGVIDFVFMGKITNRKGVYDIVKAIDKMPIEDRVRVNMIFAGSGEVDELVELAKNLGVARHLTFLGWIGSQEREDLLACCDAFILPSYNEGLPMALLEAMAWGIPSISTPVGGIPEVVKHNENGLLVEPGNVDELASAMSLLIHDANLRYAIGYQGRESMFDLNVEKYKDRISNIYRNSIKSEIAREERLTFK